VRIKRLQNGKAMNEQNKQTDEEPLKKYLRDLAIRHGENPDLWIPDEVYLNAPHGTSTTALYETTGAKI
jgi:hypothetical protein